jgi:hypothetical protein
LLEETKLMLTQPNLVELGLGLSLAKTGEYRRIEVIIVVEVENLYIN